MKKLISSKTIALCFGILVVCFAVGFYVIAWTEPTAVPPGGNVAAPINVGSVGQIKTGPLRIDGLFWGRSNAIFDGNVGIGTTAPGARLDVVGTTRMTGFQLGTTATAGHVLTADTSGVGTWQAAPGAIHECVTITNSCTGGWCVTYCSCPAGFYAIRKCGTQYFDAVACDSWNWQCGSYFLDMSWHGDEGVRVKADGAMARACCRLRCCR